MEKQLTIGRHDDNNLVIKHNRVSGRHCCVKKHSETHLLIMDKGSSNGTFVNGKRIMQTIVGMNDTLMLAEFPLDPNLLLRLFDRDPLPSGLKFDEYCKQEKIFADFAALEKVYDQYLKDKRKILKTSSLKSTGLRAGLAFVPVVGAALGVLTTGVVGNPQDQLMELEERFKKEYLCPVCFKFLGAEPFENLAKRGYCLICKSKWIR